MASGAGSSNQPPTQPIQGKKSEVQWEKVKTFNEEQQLVVDILQSIDEVQPPYNSVQTIHAIQQDLSIWQYTRAEMLSNFKIYSYARDMLESHGVVVPQSIEGNKMLLVRTMHVMWPQENFLSMKHEAYQRYQLHKEGHLAIKAGAPAPRMIQTPGRQTNRRLDEELGGTSPNKNNETSQASMFTKLQTFYKGEKQKFGGHKDENWGLEIARYERITSQLGLTRAQKVQFLHLMLKGDAETTYYQEFERINDWGELMAALNTRYNGRARKRRIEDDIRRLDVRTYVTDECHEGDALQKVATKIEELVPQCDPGENGDKQKLNAMFNAVRMRPWAAGPMSALASADKTYRQFHDELVMAEQNYRIMKNYEGVDTRSSGRSRYLRRNEPGSSSDHADLANSSKAKIWFQGQARYGRDPRAPKKMEMRFKNERRCFNCNRSGHQLKNCSLPRDDDRIMQNRVKDLMKNQTQQSQIRILKRLIKEQSAHINFLAEQLFTQFGNDDDHEEDTYDSADSSSSSSTDYHSADGHDNDDHDADDEAEDPNTTLFTTAHSDSDSDSDSDESSTSSVPTLVSSDSEDNESLKSFNSDSTYNVPGLVDIDIPAAFLSDDLESDF